MVKSVLTALVGLCLGGMFIFASVQSSGDAKSSYGWAGFLVAMTTLYAVSGLKPEDSADGGSKEDEST